MDNRCHPSSFSVMRLLAATLILLAILAGPAMAAQVQITILHTNDFHGALLPSENKKMVPPPDKVGGSAYLAGYVEEVRKENPAGVLLLDAGDIAQGTPISNLFAGLPVIEAMNLESYNAATLGNHEFDWGRKSLDRMLRTAGFPFVSSNVVVTATGRGIPGTIPYLMLDVKGVRFGILGLTNPETPSIVMASNVEGIEFRDPVATIDRYYPILKARGAEVILVLSHCGFEEDKELAAKTRGIDIIVGGHSHTEVPDPAVVNGTIVVQAGTKGRFMGRLDLTIDDESGQILAHTQHQENVPIIDSKITPVAAVAALVERYNAQVAPIMGTVIGKALVDVPHSREATMDTPLGDLLTDIMCRVTGAQVALLNSGGIRASLDQGDITMEDVFNIMPFDNCLVTMDLTGDQIRSLLEYGVRGTSALQVSGISMTFDPTAPEGERIRSLMIAGESVQPDQLYKVATLDFLATGGDGYKVFRDGKNLQYGELFRDAIINYVKANPELTAPPTGRVKSQ